MWPTGAEQLITTELATQTTIRASEPWVGMCAGLLAAGRTSAATALSARGHRTGLIHHQSPSHQLFPMARIDCALRGRVIVDLHEAKASRLTGKAVAHDRYRVHSNAGVCEEILDIRLVRTVRQISYKKLLHRSTPNCNWRQQ